MTVRAVHLALGLGALGLLAACSNLTTAYDYDPNVEFENLSTYGWMPIRSNQLTQFELERVTNAVEAGLNDMGYQRSANADFLLKVFAGRGRTLGTGYGWSGLDSKVYEEGTLIIDMVNPRTNKLIWRGSAVKPIEKNPTPEQQTSTISRAVRAVLGNFPPPGAR